MQNYYLYLEHLIDSDNVTSEARRLIAASILVNPRGKKNGFYTIDLATEFSQPRHQRCHLLLTVLAAAQRHIDFQKAIPALPLLGRIS